MSSKPTPSQNEHYDKTFESRDFAQKTLSSKTFDNCKFIKCDFNETFFSKCKFCDCAFEKCNLSLAKLKGSAFHGVEFSESKMTGINWIEAIWPNIKLLSLINFFKCDISHSTFFGLNLREINIVECKVNNVDYREADLTNANLIHSDFAESLFVNSNLTKADFSFAQNYNIDIKINKITKTKFMLPEAASLLTSLDIELVNSI